MKHKIYATALTIGLVVLAGVGLVLLWPHVPVDSVPTSPLAPPARLVCYGYVDSRHGPLLLQPARAGRALKVFVKEKQMVSKDAPLVQLDDCLVKLREDEATLAIKAAEMHIAKAKRGLIEYHAKQTQAQAALEVARINLETAKHSLTVAENMYKDGTANQGHLDLARDRRDQAKALLQIEESKIVELKAVDPNLEVKLAQLERDRAQIQLQQARRDREEYTMKAPVAGTILRMCAQEGDMLSPASPRPAIWLAPKDDLIVRAEVSQEFAERVVTGLKVRVEDEASGSLLAAGAVGEVSDWFLPRRQFSMSPTSINTGLTLDCVIDLETGLSHLRIGQRVRVRVLAHQSDQGP
ncbi:MAG TPA: HlyD family efflux transporter periplasmic adaptor subunit [Gemmataceae bacterium]|nr:HlyD family efflux transporter periplasmic adaptor subunit [Gemmataceae bacterium]